MTIRTPQAIVNRDGHIKLLIDLLHSARLCGMLTIKCVADASLDRKGHEVHYETQRPQRFFDKHFFSMPCALSVFFVRFVFQKKLITPNEKIIYHFYR